MPESVLVVALDGLDKELIEKFDLEYIKQGEFGGIDNKTGMTGIKTSELFASFITGKTYEKHGVKGLNKNSKFKWKERLSNLLFPNYLVSNFRGFTRLKKAFNLIIGGGKDKYTKEDLDSETLFDKIDNSKALFIPSYNPSIFWIARGKRGHLRDFDYRNKRFLYYWDEYEYETRKRKLLRPVNKWFDFCMMHFHRPDLHQHYYGDPELSTYDEEKLRKLYQETDELAKDIIEYFSEDYDTIIFMSDHGLPTEDEHNENAFYSCNHKLFADETPHITDFHDKILELVGSTEES
jgi:hypothetical protein